MRHRGGIRWAVFAAAVAVPVAVAYRRSRPSDYTRSREFKALVGDYLI